MTYLEKHPDLNYAGIITSSVVLLVFVPYIVIVLVLFNRFYDQSVIKARIPRLVSVSNHLCAIWFVFLVIHAGFYDGTGLPCWPQRMVGIMCSCLIATIYLARAWVLLFKFEIAQKLAEHAAETGYGAVVYNKQGGHKDPSTPSVRKTDLAMLLVGKGAFYMRNRWMSQPYAVMRAVLVMALIYSPIVAVLIVYDQSCDSWWLPMAGNIIIGCHIPFGLFLTIKIWRHPRDAFHIKHEYAWAVLVAVVAVGVNVAIGQVLDNSLANPLISAITPLLLITLSGWWPVRMASQEGSYITLNRDMKQRRLSEDYRKTLDGLDREERERKEAEKNSRDSLTSDDPSHSVTEGRDRDKHKTNKNLHDKSGNSSSVPSRSIAGQYSSQQPHDTNSNRTSLLKVPLTQQHGTVSSSSPFGSPFSTPQTKHKSPLPSHGTHSNTPSGTPSASPQRIIRGRTKLRLMNLFHKRPARPPLHEIASLDELLAIDGGFGSFLTYLQREFAHENLLFWCDVRDFHNKYATLVGGTSVNPPSSTAPTSSAFVSSSPSLPPRAPLATEIPESSPATVPPTLTLVEAKAYYLQCVADVLTIYHQYISSEAPFQCNISYEAHQHIRGDLEFCNIVDKSILRQTSFNRQQSQSVHIHLLNLLGWSRRGQLEREASKASTISTHSTSSSKSVHIFGRWFRGTPTHSLTSGNTGVMPQSTREQILLEINSGRGLSNQPSNPRGTLQVPGDTSASHSKQNSVDERAAALSKDKGTHSKQSSIGETSGNNSHTPSTSTVHLHSFPPHSGQGSGATFPNTTRQGASAGGKSTDGAWSRSAPSMAREDSQYSTMKGDSGTAYPTAYSEPSLDDDSKMSEEERIENLVQKTKFMADIFEMASKQVLSLMERDSLPRYSKSDEYLELRMRWGDGQDRKRTYVGSPSSDPLHVAAVVRRGPRSNTFLTTGGAEAHLSTALTTVAMPGTSVNGGTSMNGRHILPHVALIFDPPSEPPSSRAVSEPATPVAPSYPAQAPSTHRPLQLSPSVLSHATTMSPLSASAMGSTPASSVGADSPAFTPSHSMDMPFRSPTSMANPVNVEGEEFDQPEDDQVAPLPSPSLGGADKTRLSRIHVQSSETAEDETTIETAVFGEVYTPSTSQRARASTSHTTRQSASVSVTVPMVVTRQDSEDDFNASPVHMHSFSGSRTPGGANLQDLPFVVTVDAVDSHHSRGSSFRDAKISVSDRRSVHVHSHDEI